MLFFTMKEFNADSLVMECMSEISLTWLVIKRPMSCKKQHTFHSLRCVQNANVAL